MRRVVVVEGVDREGGKGRRFRGKGCAAPDVQLSRKFMTPLGKTEWRIGGSGGHGHGHTVTVEADSARTTSTGTSNCFIQRPCSQRSGVTVAQLAWTKQVPGVPLGCLTKKTTL